ncbi:hypothetical protein GW764_04165 [Candidatus Parcubacteria bacterium]|nr:hypothetical protein [Candidatus Parcubacteria bacterium]
MKLFVIFPHYLAWHYTIALKDFFSIWGNIIWFLYNFFSIEVLFKTFFSPFKRLTERKKDLLDIGGFFETLLINTLMRIIGMVLRTIIIISGLVSLAVSFFIGLVSFFLWLALPFIIIFMMIVSLMGLFKI